MYLKLKTIITLTISAFLFITSAKADTIQVAVASNFKSTMMVLAQQYEAQSKHEILVSSGSTGKHYAQITNGAPFDFFFAADSGHPKQLEKQGVGVRGTRYTYAIGRLVLWGAGTAPINVETLVSNNFKYISLANPLLAPYGRAAEETINKLDLSVALQSKKVTGENVIQALQFVATGNADIGFVGLSQIRNINKFENDSYWLIPQEYYSPIEQQAIVLKDKQANHDFLTFMQSETARKIILTAGYAVPPVINSYD